MKKMTFKKFKEVMQSYNKSGAVVTGVIVFTKDSFQKEYSELARSYEVRSDAKFFSLGALGNSLYGACLDGMDVGVRLDYYMHDGWKPEFCYINE